MRNNPHRTLQCKVNHNRAELLKMICLASFSPETRASQLVVKLSEKCKLCWAAFSRTFNNLEIICYLLPVPVKNQNLLVKANLQNLYRHYHEAR